MYAAYFGLNSPPFSISPDPRFLFLSARHSEALAHLMYGLSGSGGFIQLTGEVGTGKTTLIRRLLDELPADVDVALILNPRLTPHEFLHAIARELHLASRPDTPVGELVEMLNAHLLDAHARGRRTVLIVDEAQQLASEVLEQVRLLTNLETPTQKLLQIILIGQPELRDTLARADLRQLAQRITARYHLEALRLTDTRAYIRHRLAVAGAPGQIFLPAAERSIHRIAQGIPRLINILCDRALLAAYTREQRQIPAALARRAAHEVAPPRPARRWPLWAAGLLLAGCALALGALWVKDAWPTLRPEPAARALVAEPAHTPASPPLADMLATLPGDTDTALTGLLALWGVAYQPASPQTACAQAAAAGLRCLYQRGTWNNLRALNRPAILTLLDKTGQPHQAVLTRLTADQATLHFGTATRSVALSELDPAWYGEFLLLWQPPPTIERVLAPGSQGAGVQWLRAELVALQEGTALADNSPIYDPALEARVRAFQASRRITEDGIAGEITLLHLNVARGVSGTPQLTGN